MDARKVSSQFAAYVWFSHGKPEGPQTQEAAWRFARENWGAFLPNSHEGVGRLLLRIAEPDARGRREAGTRQSLRHKLAAAR